MRILISPFCGRRRRKLRVLFDYPRARAILEDGLRDGYDDLNIRLDWVEALVTTRPVDSCGWLQSRARHTSPDRHGHAAQSAGPPDHRAGLGLRPPDIDRTMVRPD